MPDLIVNMQEQADELHERWDELRKLKIDPPGPSADEKSRQRKAIVQLMSKISNKWEKFDLIILHNKSSKVLVNAPSDEDKTRLKEAIVSLSKTIKREQTFSNIIDTVNLILGSASTIINATEG